MSDDFDKIAELTRNGYSIDEALNHVPQTEYVLPSATTTVEGGVILATPAEVTTGTTSKVPPVSALVAHEGVCKAWVNFNGTGTVAIRDSYNVSSITDDGVGLYTVNFSTNMANANYAVFSMASGDAVSGKSTFENNGASTRDSAAVGSIKMQVTASTTGTSADAISVNVAVFGDQ